MKTLKNILTPVSDALDKLCSVLIVVMLGLMVIITGAQIICRTWFTALTWSDEVTRYLLIWSTFLGASVVYRHSGHISVTIVQDAVPPRLSKILRVAVHAICFVLFTVLLYFSCTYCMKLNKTATTLPIKMKYIYLCVPISMVILMVHSLLMAVEEATKEVKA
ncbi:MAG: TRAP transporter small permease [Clostridiales bacterium]|nr:TRAP transporter small permease [Clostridiales bacterium]MDY5348684.1 TRAP transporter small permease [Candidatus Ventricola sp.]MDY5514601.1 TRAP transporter small permease [Candidatus Ventricola sp.]